MVHRIPDDTLEIGTAKSGGFVVDDITARDAITTNARYRGMVVRLIDGHRYVLGAGLTNSDWTQLANDGYEFQQTNFSATFQPDIEFFVETTGNDVTGDGLTVGTAFATLQRVFDELPPTFLATVSVHLGSGSFAGATLNSTKGRLFIDGYVTILDTVTFVSDDGAVPGKAMQRNATVSAYDGYGGGFVAEGGQVLRIPVPGFPFFNAFRILRASASPSLRTIKFSAESFSTGEIVTLDSTLTSGISGFSGGLTPTLGNIVLDSSSSVFSASSVTINNCRIIGANGATLSNLSGFNSTLCDTTIDLAAATLVRRYGEILAKDSLIFRDFAVPTTGINGVFDSDAPFGGHKLEFGGRGSGAAEGAGIDVNDNGPIDFEGTSDCMRFHPGSFVKQGDTITCDGTGHLFELAEGVLYDANGESVTGTVTEASTMAAGCQLIAASAFTVSNTVAPGDDIVVGPGATADAFGDLPIVDATTFTRASDV